MNRALFIYLDAPSRIDVFEDDLYVSTRLLNKIYRLKKSGAAQEIHPGGADPPGAKVLLARGPRRIGDIVIVQQYKQQHNFSGGQYSTVRLLYTPLTLNPAHFSGDLGVHVGLFLNHANLIDCSFSTTNENDVILG